MGLYKILFSLALCQIVFGQNARFFVKLTEGQYKDAQGMAPFAGIPNAKSLFPYDGRFRNVCPNASSFEWLLDRVAVVTAPSSEDKPCGDAEKTRRIYEVLPQAFSMQAVNDPEAGAQVPMFRQINSGGPSDVRVGVNDIVIVTLDGKIAPHEDLPSYLSSFAPGQGEVHGTAVAGVLGAITGNGRGIMGISNVPIISFPVFWGVQSGEKLIADTDEVEVFKALLKLHTLPQNLIIVNMSFSRYEDEADRKNWDIWGEVLGGLVRSGRFLLVAGAGNQSSPASRNQPGLTVSRLGGITVGGVDQNDALVPNSAYGEVVGLSAPWDSLTTIPNNRYAWVGGTSISSPIVAASAAEILKRAIALGYKPNTQNLLNALRLGARFAPKLAGRTAFPGILDVENSYQELLNILTGKLTEVLLPVVYGARENWTGSKEFQLGDYVSIFGENLKETRVFLNDRELPILFSSDIQVNVRLPESIFGGWQTTNTLSLVKIRGGVPLAYTGVVVKKSFTFKNPKGHP